MIEKVNYKTWSKLCLQQKSLDSKTEMDWKLKNEKYISYVLVSFICYNKLPLMWWLKIVEI